MAGAFLVGEIMDAVINFCIAIIGGIMGGIICYFIDKDEDDED